MEFCIVWIIEINSISFGIFRSEINRVGFVNLCGGLRAKKLSLAVITKRLRSSIKSQKLLMKIDPIPN